MRHGLAAVALFAVSTSALGIVVTTPSQYVPRPANAHVGHLGGGSCVPIGARFAITAAHVGVSGKAKVLVDGVVYPVKRTIVHPNAPTVDLKIIEIAGPPFFPGWVDLHPAPTTVPVNTRVFIGGTGYDTGQPTDNCISWKERGEHWAYNNIEGYFSSTVNYAWYRFDDEMPREGVATLYDSGSPMLVQYPGDCRMYLMGIATSASTATGPSCDGHAAYYLLTDDPWLDQFTGPACLGDIDRDGDTDLSDFVILLNAFNGIVVDCSTRIRCDLNEDGRINVTDFSILSLHFGCVP